MRERERGREDRRRSAVKQMGMQRLGGREGMGFERVGQLERNGGKKETWKWHKAKLESEQMCLHLEMTDSPFLCHNEI